MEMKVVCNCGQKYKFDVEPVNGQMPTRVNCPVCGADGTATANGVLSQMLSASPAPLRMAVTAPPAPAAVPMSPPPMAAPAAGSGLRLNRPAPAPVATPPPLPSAPAVLTAVPPTAPALRKSKEPGNYSLGLGILGAVLGAALGAGLMYGFFLWADFRFPLMGTCIGVLTGLGARMLAKGTDTTLGGIAGGIAFASTAGTLYLMFGEVSGLFIISMVVSVSFAYKIAG